jgi:hypothetical protein
MITPRDVMAHLWRYLPSVTNLFNEQLTITNVTVTGGLITGTITAGTPTVDQKLLLSGIKVRNPIVAYVNNGDGTARFTTAHDHDQTEPHQRLDTQQLQLGGITPSVWNGLHSIDSIPNRRTFEIKLIESLTLDGSWTFDGTYVLDEVTPPTGGYLIEQPTGVLGIGTVTAVVGTTVTIDPAEGIFHYDGVIDTITVNTRIRARAAADITRAEAIYTKQGAAKPFIFVIMTDVSVSKDRHTPNDGLATFTKQDMRLLRLLQNFAIAVFIPTADDIGGDNAQHMAYGEIYSALTKIFYGFGFSDESAIDYVTVSAGHGPGLYNSAYYLHVYDWQVPNVITFESGFDGQSPFITDVAFRDINQSLYVNSSDKAIMSMALDLDEEPLP